MRICFFILLSSLLFSCKNDASGDGGSEKPLSDSLLQLVLDGHDVAMPKMMKLSRLQKEAQAEMDSLKGLPGAAHTARIAALDSTIKKLSFADVSMNEWMEGFRYDSLKNDETARVAYLKMQLESVNQMKDIVLATIEEADSVLAK
ncbi:viral A-type inclusion protein [Niabella insulamsoli]|uniref:viral A-type inclusion protein n=1 Tax=Niabella insulamsoli TaxID=3144874 RepID=UPI0031FBC316